VISTIALTFPRIVVDAADHVHITAAKQGFFPPRYVHLDASGNTVSDQAVSLPTTVFSSAQDMTYSEAAIAIDPLSQRPVIVCEVRFRELPDAPLEWWVPGWGMVPIGPVGQDTLFELIVVLYLDAAGKFLDHKIAYYRYGWAVLTPKNINPAIAIDTRGRAHVVWNREESEGFDCRIAYRNIDADTFSTISGGLVTPTSRPAIAASDDGAVHIAWNQSGKIYYQRTDHNGLTEIDDTVISGPQAAAGGRPALAIAGPGVKIVWQDSRDGNLEIYERTLMDYGFTLGQSGGSPSPRTPPRSLPSRSQARTRPPLPGRTSPTETGRFC
jgi:hypothetical protein